MSSAQGASTRNGNKDDRTADCTSCQDTSSSSTSPVPLHSHSSRPPAATSQQIHNPNSGTVLCAACVKAYLKETRARRARVVEEHEKLRQKCQLSLEQSPPWGELQYQLMDLHKKSEKLRAAMNHLALQTARMACQNEERKAALTARSNQVVPQREILRRWDVLLLDGEKGALKTGVIQTCHKVRRIRFQWAVAAFQMHRLDVKNVQQMTHRMKHAKGIGKIGGLPLPHAGPELYSVLPPAELQSALRLVASLTSLVASCLGIVLPHPILLTTNGSIGDLAASTASGKEAMKSLSADHRSSSNRRRVDGASSKHGGSSASLSSSTASLASYVGQTVGRVLGPATKSSRSLEREARQSSSYLKSSVTTSAGSSSPSKSINNQPNLNSDAVQQRIHHAMSAVLAEAPSTHDRSGASIQHYALSVATMQQPDGEEFTIALQLLQNNIVALCIRAGAPVSHLWPAEAVLLNLHTLHEFCREQAKFVTPMAVNPASV